MVTHIEDMLKLFESGSLRSECRATKRKCFHWKKQRNSALCQTFRQGVEDGAVNHVGMNKAGPATRIDEIGVCYSYAGK